MQINVQPKTIFCKNHPNSSSEYFLSDQPWIKYCKNCALNVALCGRKIEKQFTPEQYHRKMQITSIVNDLKNSIAETKISQELYAKLEDYLKDMVLPLGDQLKEIEKSIKELISIKQNLQKIYQKDLMAQIQHFNRQIQQSKKNEVNMIKMVQHIESNLGNLVELEDPQQFSKEQNRWKSVITCNEKDILNQHSFEDLKTQLKTHICNFIDISSQATQFRVCLTNFNETQLSKSQENKENMLTSPIYGNSFESSRLDQELKLGLTANSKLRLRSTKKTGTDQNIPNFSKNPSKRQSFQAHSNCSEWQVQIKKDNHRY